MAQEDDLNIELYDEDTDFENESGEEIEEEEPELFNQPFDPTKIRIDTKPITIDLILKRIKYDEIDLAPDFQRQANIWTDKAKSRLIESIILCIPLPSFYLDATIEDKWVVIDGIQRLNTLKRFVIDKDLKLTELEFLKDIENKTYDELPRYYQRRIEETNLTVYLIEKGTSPQVKFNIFRRINTGGLPLSPQELRHAINPGKANSFLSKLSNCSEFERVTKLSKKRKTRMDDQEFVLGFVAFTLTSYENYPVDEGRDYFLNEAMAKINKLSTEQKNELEKLFIKAMVIAFQIFGKDAFRKIYRNQTKRYPINKALFESWSVIFSKLEFQEFSKITANQETLKNKLMDYIENDEMFLKSISQAANYVNYRFKTIKKIVEEVLKC